ncbi:hypothetical protein [Microbacterium sp. TNHR37B]|uniref:hypothetical protein n=1 Tax=Microbacterium sp. TNHR37B TaxID=1775956 RepID=UPI0007B2292A|nr:hypothetical protein [Microbacterium sp. TNHR37B]KZE91032.1 hypothetical protein AVP41_00563 [Microbacterium sp. TNHR37B]
MSTTSDTRAMADPFDRSSQGRFRVGGADLLRVSERCWRAMDRSGRVLGHIQARGESDARRYVARRFLTSRNAYRDLGEFWTLREAVDCVRFSR